MTLGPLVAPSLCSGRYSPGPSGILNHVDLSVPVSNYFMVASVALMISEDGCACLVSLGISMSSLLTRMCLVI